ncbi:MAG: YchJ family metal-binding protein [Agitococcus sp.]|nr:YchJ family metal-binding protein [Agitococcus sp.]
MKKTDPCPCCSGKSYGECCNFFLGGATPALTAEQLMRSRYTAFTLEKAHYLVETHHAQSRKQDELKALKKSFKGMMWTGLEIVATQAGAETDSEGEVEFVAHFKHFGKAGRLHERSRFNKEKGQWFYVDGDILSDA